MEGGPSHIDLFDPKPLLKQLAGKPLPESFGTVITAMGEYDAPILASPRKWKQYGRNGTWVSEWLPHLAQCVDDFAVIRSCWADGLNHSNGVCQMNTGSILGGRPSLGAWVSYGLGTENENLPAFVVMEDDPGKVVNGPRNWGPGFMPATYQGTPVFGDQEPIRNLMLPKGVTESTAAGETGVLEPAEPTPSGDAPRTDGAGGPHQELRTGVSHASHGAGGRRSAAGNRRNASPVRPGPAGNRVAGPDVPAGPAAGRAGRAVRPAVPRLRQQVGRSFRAGEEPFVTVPQHGQARGRFAPGPEANAASWTRRWCCGAASSAGRR